MACRWRSEVIKGELILYFDHVIPKDGTQVVQLCPLSPPTNPLDVLFEWPDSSFWICSSQLSRLSGVLVSFFFALCFSWWHWFLWNLHSFLFVSEKCHEVFYFFASFSVMLESCRDLWSWGEFLLNHFRHFHYNMCMQFLGSFDSLGIINIPWRWVDVNTILRWEGKSYKGVWKVF